MGRGERAGKGEAREKACEEKSQARELAGGGATASARPAQDFAVRGSCSGERPVPQCFGSPTPRRRMKSRQSRVAGENVSGGVTLELDLKGWTQRMEEKSTFSLAYRTANEELQKSQAEREALKKELDEFKFLTPLEEILSMKQKTLNLLQQHFKEEENKFQRQQAMSQDCIQRITDLNSKIQEEKLRRRKQRMEFEQQLEELMEKHKALWELHTPEMLAQEINSTASSKEQLLQEEKLIQEKLDGMEKRLPVLPHPKARAEALAVNSVDTFLCSEEAAAAMHLFEEENKKAMQFLEAASQHYHQLQQQYCRLKMELEAGGQSDIRESKGSITEAAAEGGSGVVAEGAQSEVRTPEKPGLGDFSFQVTQESSEDQKRESTRDINRQGCY
ncbi:synaptonemal complex central element protein 1-like [Phascolarctos cinereus]